jgi:hypothetical protein
MSSDMATSLCVLEELGGLETVLLNFGEMPLLAEAQAAAERLGIPLVEFSTLAVRRFINRASDDDWALLTSRANADEDALGSIVIAIVRRAVGDVKEVFP